DFQGSATVGRTPFAVDIHALEGGGCRRHVNLLCLQEAVTSARADWPQLIHCNLDQSNEEPGKGKGQQTGVRVPFPTSTEKVKKFPPSQFLSFPSVPICVIRGYWSSLLVPTHAHRWAPGKRLLFPARGCAMTAAGRFSFSRSRKLRGVMGFSVL